MMNQKMSFALVLFIGIVAAATASVKLPVTIYYESLCPDSAKLITEQVHPALKSELKDYIDITWVPFGKSSFSTQGSDVLFTCHHGPNECYGNKVHSCALEHIQSNSYETAFTRESLILDFISCLMRAGKNFDDNVYPGARCAKDNRIATWEVIQQCANSTEGSNLLKRYGEATNKFESPLLSVPTVVFKDQHDPKVSQRAMTNFLSTACEYISVPKPRICATNGATSNTFYYGITLLSALVYAFIKVL